MEQRSYRILIGAAVIVLLLMGVWYVRSFPTTETGTPSFPNEVTSASTQDVLREQPESFAGELSTNELSSDATSSAIRADLDATVITDLDAEFKNLDADVESL